VKASLTISFSELRGEGLATENDINTFKDQLELGS